MGWVSGGWRVAGWVFLVCGASVRGLVNAWAGGRALRVWLVSGACLGWSGLLASTSGGPFFSSQPLTLRCVRQSEIRQHAVVPGRPVTSSRDQRNTPIEGFIEERAIEVGIPNFSRFVAHV